MKCINCKNEINDNINYCPNCGTYQIKKGMSLVTKISLTILILLSVFFIGLTIILMIAGEQNDAVGWLLGFNFMTYFLVVPYYIFIFIVSLSFDNKKNSNKKLRNILVPILLILPIMTIIILAL